MHATPRDVSQAELVAGRLTAVRDVVLPDPAARERPGFVIFGSLPRVGWWVAPTIWRTP
jgi:hypothetical protein